MASESRVDEVDEEWFSNVLRFQYVMLAAFCVGVYDWRACCLLRLASRWLNRAQVLTLDAEIELVWSSRWNFVTLLWALIRYVPLATFLALEAAWFHPTGEKSCGLYALIAGSLITLTVLLCHCAFALRTSALYNHDTRVRCVLGGLLAAEVGVLVFSTVRSVQLAAHSEMHPRIRVRGCLSGVPESAFGILTCSVPFAYDCVIFGLTLVRSIAYVRRNKSAPVVPVLLRDGVGYFMAILACYLVNTLMFTYGKSNEKVITTGFSIMIPVVITLRLMLNLRGCAVLQTSSKDVAAGEDASAHFLTGIEGFDDSLLSLAHLPAHTKSCRDGVDDQER